MPGGGRNSWGSARALSAAIVLVALALGVVGAVGLDGGARASTSDPPASIYPNPPFFQSCSSATYDDSGLCVSQTVQAIDNARAQEGVGGLGLPSDWYALSPQQQMFVATNLERTARGLPPMSGMATRLDQVSNQAAAGGQDPVMPGDFPSSRWTSNWAGGSGNPLEDIYFWMYYDGPASNNVGCQQAGQPGCWIHRHNILVSLACQPCVNGSGFSPNGWNGETSWAELLADTSGAPPQDFSWSQVVPYLPDPSEAGVGGGMPAASPNYAATPAPIPTTAPSSRAPAPAAAPPAPAPSAPAPSSSAAGNFGASDTSPVPVTLAAGGPRAGASNSAGRSRTAVASGSARGGRPKPARHRAVRHQAMRRHHAVRHHAVRHHAVRHRALRHRVAHKPKANKAVVRVALHTGRALPASPGEGDAGRRLVLALAAGMATSGAGLLLLAFRTERQRRMVLRSQ